MKLIADSGSTKTDWALVSDEGSVSVFHTQGINPVHQDAVAIRRILTDELEPQLQQAPIDEVFFYGSGVRPAEEAGVCMLLRESFGAALVEAHSDLLGAARALCGHGEGLACILGTGANSCLYDGLDIVSNTPPLGYILGDEGSGAVLGVTLVNALYKGLLPDSLRSDFEQEYALTLDQIIMRVYRQPLPNRFLASLSPFVSAHLDQQQVCQLVVDHFRRFLQRNVATYHRPDLPLSAVGSIAYFFCEQLGQAAALEGYTIGRVERSPLRLLVDYHT